MQVVSNHGRETAYVETDSEADGGTGTALYVHGSGGSHEVWRPQLRLTDRPATALDLSGHGHSEDIDASPGYTTRSAYADDVLAVADATDASVLVGSSLGGAVVLHVLLERADEFTPEAVVLTGTGARMGVLEDLLEWLESDFERALEFLHEPDRLFHDPSSETRERSLEAMRECGQEVTRRDFLTCHDFDVRDRLGEIDVPVLAAYGEYDQLTPPWFHEYLADEIPDASLAEIEDAAHMPMVEQPRAFDEAVSEFLASVQ
ncbi:alpha/beta hydrolase [Halobacteria archaeon AArc-m2/3/4]|uniref:Alpha/beta hydrolase n=1 Tax=Natronoglomus mannanivorans TaxID=2979990 RepID=A0AAP2YWQ6_9EURY|nr:alpha/beta hydrolase [Halobacteria archaeon AArc-xg1-1]MCU4971492.1 alpha/beta hydrolase [Halobacteria archaeon AArc-m2/3/4]